MVSVISQSISLISEKKNGVGGIRNGVEIDGTYGRTFILSASALGRSGRITSHSHFWAIGAVVLKVLMLGMLRCLGKRERSM